MNTVARRDDFLAHGLRKMNSLEPDGLAELSHQLRLGLKNNLKTFGKHAFRKHVEGQYNRSVLNASLWDVISPTGLSQYPESVVDARADELREAFYLLMSDEPFIKAITYGVNDIRKVRYRSEITRTMVLEALGAHAD